jgi:hypothetical protein
MVIVSKAAFEQDFDLDVGGLYETAEYNSKNKALEPVAAGGSLFLVTARPGDSLWLIGILENPVFVGDRWTASANTVKILLIGTKEKMQKSGGTHGKKKSTNILRKTTDLKELICVLMNVRE